MIQPDYTRIERVLAARSTPSPTPPRRTARSPAACARAVRLPLRGLAAGDPARGACRWRRPPRRCANCTTPPPSALMQHGHAVRAAAARGRASRSRQRTAALAQWCQGFLYGLGAGSHYRCERLPGDIGEIVRDFTEITRAGVDAKRAMSPMRAPTRSWSSSCASGCSSCSRSSAAARAPAPLPTAAPLH